MKRCVLKKKKVIAFEYLINNLINNVLDFLKIFEMANLMGFLMRHIKNI